MTWLALAWKFLRGLPWWVWAALALAIAVACVYQTGVRNGRAEVQASWDAATARAQRDADIRAAKEDAARLARVDRGKKIIESLKQENANALAASDAVIADLRSGLLRLRDHWRCPVSATAEVGAGAGRDHGAAERREEGAGDLVRVAAEADAQLRACQATLNADRKQING